MVKHPNDETIKVKVRKKINTYICFGYDKDLYQIYDFYCARYENIKYDEFLDLGINEIIIKLMSIPKEEPLYEIIKSRIINTSKIKDKEERKYWEELKQINRIPDIYLPDQEIEDKLKESLGGIKNGKRFM